MNLGDLTVALFDRGFDEIGPARAQRWLNEAYHEICADNNVPWPFLENDSSGTAPLTIADLNKAISCIDTTDSIALRYVPRAWIAQTFGSVTAPTTMPMYWYVDSGTTVKIFPAAAAKTISVRYIKVPTDLVAVTDTPLFPPRYHELIVDGAARRAYENIDRYDLAQQVEVLRQQGVEKMKAELLVVAVPSIDPIENYDEPVGQQ